MDENSDKAPSGDQVTRSPLLKRLGRPTLFALCFVGIAFLVWAAEVVRIYMEPPRYAGETLIEFTSPPEGAETPDFQREFEILQSQRCLDLVVKKMSLDKEWNLTPYQACMQLREDTKFEPIADYRMARVTVHRSDALLAAKIADAIPEAYSNYRRSGEERVADRRADYLETQISMMQDRVERARVKWLDIMANYSSTPIEDSPIVVRNAKAIDPRTIDGDNGFADYLSARRQMIVVEESKGEYDRARDRLDQMQREHLAARSAPEPAEAIALHAHAVIPSNPVLPDVDNGLAAGKGRALLIGLAGAIVALLILPLRKPAARRVKPPANTGTADAVY